MDIALPLVMLLVLLLAGMPIGFALLVTGALGISLVASPDTMLGVLQTLPYRSTTSYSLVTIPMFVLMANFITKGGLGRDIFESLRQWTGRLPGGSVIATIYASAGLGAICGSSAAAASTMGQVAIPELKRQGYSPALSVGAVAVAGTLAIMIPPSTGLIFYAILTEQSIGAMLIAGIVPGLIMALALSAGVLAWAIPGQRRGTIPRGTAFSLKQKLYSSRLLWPFVVLIVAIVGGIYFGVVSAIEASALGAAISLLMLVLLRRITWPEMVHGIKDTVYVTTMIYIIILGAHAFGQFLSMSRVPSRMLEALTTAGLGRWTVMLLILLAVLVMGFFMDQLAILSLSLPLIFPVIMELGFDPIWFGIVMILLAEIGLVTPPMGLNVFVAAGAANEPVEVGFRGIWPFVGIMFAVLALLLLVPDIATFMVPADLS
ncbi:TRAP transporter large permease [Blastococcus saxobsidens]|uniref:TRAP transporter, DctM subunit n=1 Tax=Blastococcus saxobsidens (strain DD2) TaxID=1146883 RepID=H6RNQ4_BLASD|nr:TRAP transporter large permease [Blastococcus saxobsidens]CCG05202.1 TRAP transporter, DctM subunit [Blastococcus saxobsidens DD2]